VTGPIQHFTTTPNRGQYRPAYGVLHHHRCRHAHVGGWNDRWCKHLV